MTQSDGSVEIYFGGVDEESKETLIITGVENGMVYAYFDGIPERELVFEPAMRGKRGSNNSGKRRCASLPGVHLFL